MNADPPVSSNKRNSGTGSAPSSANVTRPRMQGSMLPRDSFRLLRGDKKTKKLAAAGLDLLREGLDGKKNLGSISEADGAGASSGAAPPVPVPLPSYGSSASSSTRSLQTTNNGKQQQEQQEDTRSHLVVCYGEKLLRHAVRLYRAAIKSFSDGDVDSICYIVPTCSDVTPHGVQELETFRNELVKAGIPPHHILMDCSAATAVDNALKLLDVMRHYQFEKLVLVANEPEYSYVELCFQSVLFAQKELVLHVACHLFQGGTVNVSEMQSATQRAQSQLPDALETARHKPSLSRPPNSTQSNVEQQPLWTVHKPPPTSKGSEKYITDV